MYQSYQFSVLSCHAIGVLDQSLELIVLGKSDDLQHCAKLRENLGRGDSIIRDVIMITHSRFSQQPYLRINKANLHLF